MTKLAVRKLAGATVVAICLHGAMTGTALAYDWPKKLASGSKGRHVTQLQARIAGWYPGAERQRFQIDGEFGKQTVVALERFERHYKIKRPNGVAQGVTFDVLDRLEDSDGSTAHFDWSEFQQHSNSGCSAQANAYAGTFGGGGVSPGQTKRNVKRLMWRLEALRAKAGGKPIGINSGFRSVAYNACIGGASVSQHMYGTAADNRVSGISNDEARRIARGSQFHGISCYSNTTHNHFDLRLENKALPYAQNWWWPREDSLGRELDDSGRPCWGESSGSAAASVRLASVRSAVPGVGSLIPTVAEVRAFEEAGELGDLEGSD
jgi:zinc D-Ala-D-Ala carboxypeptidase